MNAQVFIWIQIAVAITLAAGYAAYERARRRRAL